MSKLEIDMVVTVKAYPAIGSKTGEAVLSQGSRWMRVNGSGCFQCTAASPRRLSSPSEPGDAQLFVLVVAGPGDSINAVIEPVDEAVIHRAS